jgi:co-chaperonin GroES (HSP10)
MRAIGKNLIIQKIKEGTTATKGGLLLAENQREDIRYVEAKVLHIGDEVVGVKEGDIVFCQSLTFSATANPIIYERAIPVFIDSETETWNAFVNQGN